MSLCSLAAGALVPLREPPEALPYRLVLWRGSAPDGSCAVGLVQRCVAWQHETVTELDARALQPSGGRGSLRGLGPLADRGALLRGAAAACRDAPASPDSRQRQDARRA
eukprot:2580169-Alexandrium_andersonii.AAC.1